MSNVRNEQRTTPEVTQLLASLIGRLAERARTQQETAPLDARRSYTRRQAANALGVSVWLIDRARKEGLLREAEPLGPRDVRLTGASLLLYQREREERERTLVQVL